MVTAPFEPPADYDPWAINPRDVAHELHLYAIEGNLPDSLHDDYIEATFRLDADQRATYDATLSDHLRRHSDLEDAHGKTYEFDPTRTVDDYRALMGQPSSSGDGAQTGAIFIDPRELAPPDPTPFPLHVFPDVITDMVRSEARAIQVAEDLPAMVALGMLATIATHRRIAVSFGTHRQLCNLFLVVALPPGAGKSPVFKRLSEPVQQFAVSLREESRKNIARLNVEKELLKKKVDHANNSVRGPEHTEEHRKAFIDASLEYDDFQVPAEPYTLYGGADMTSEAYKKLLHSNGGTLSVMSDEGGFFQNLTRYLKAGQAPEIDGPLHAWDGGRVSVERAGSTNFAVDNAYSSMMFCVQPIVLRQLLGNDVLVGRGLADRFMCCEPKSLVGKRDYINRHERDLQACVNYDEWMAAFCNVEFKGTTLRASREAVELFARWQQKNEDNIWSGQYGDIPGLISKVNSCTQRVAGLLHLLWGQNETQEITVERMAQAIEVGEYWLAHALRIIAINHADHNHDGCQRILTWMNRQDGNEFTLRAIMRSGPVKRSHGNDQVKPLLKQMLDMGWITTSDPQWESPIVGFEPATFSVVHRVEMLSDSCPTVSDQSDSDPSEWSSEHLERHGVGQSDSRTKSVSDSFFSKSLIYQHHDSDNPQKLSDLSDSLSDSPKDDHEECESDGTPDDDIIAYHEVTGRALRRSEGLL